MSPLIESLWRPLSPAPSVESQGADASLPARMPWTKSELLALAGVLIAMLLFYSRSLLFGYFYDDFWILKENWQTADPLHLLRPVWLLANGVFASISTDALFQRVVSLICFCGVAIVGF